MTALLLAAAGFGYYALCTVFIIICVLLIFMVVITPSAEGGMAAAFGGMGSDSFFGTKAHQSINKFTVFLAVSFLLLAFWINWSNKGSATTADPGTKPRSATEEKMKNLPQTPKNPAEAPPAPPK